MAAVKFDYNRFRRLARKAVCGAIEKTRLLIDQFLESTPVLQPVDIETMRQAELRKAEVLGIGIPWDEKGVMFLAEEACVLPRGCGPIGDHVGIAYEGR